MAHLLKTGWHWVYGRDIRCGECRTVFTIGPGDEFTNADRYVQASDHHDSSYWVRRIRTACPSCKQNVYIEK